MIFPNNEMQLVGWHNKFIFKYHAVFSKQRNFATRNECSCFALVNTANMDLLCSYPWGKCMVVLHSFVYHFVLLALKNVYARIPCSTAWPHACKCETSARKITCYSLFSQGQYHLTPWPWYAAIHALQLRSKLEASSYIATDHSNGQHQDQYSRWRHEAMFSG